MFEVGRQGIAIHKNVVEEHRSEFAQEWLEKGVHCSLEGRWGITETEWHYAILIMTLVGAECGFLDIVGHY